MNLTPEFLSRAGAPGRKRPRGGARRRIRAWQAKAAAFQAALLVFLLTAALVGAVAYTLDRNARRSTIQQSATELASGSRVAASAFSALRANLRASAGQIATSLELQRAVIAGDRSALERIARARHARILIAGRAVGTLAPLPRIASTAAITNGGQVLARVTIAVSLSNDLLKLMRDETPLPAEAALVLVQNGHVVAGGPRGAAADIRDGRIAFGSSVFEAESTPLGVRNTRVLAVEPVRAVEARALPYRRRLFVAAVVTLALAAAIAARLGRPVARLLNDVARLSRQAQTDSLTGLANRRSLDERLDVELARARLNKTNLGFVIADVDDFKQINDRYGHQTGDEILRAVARACGDLVRECDLAGRWGGEEFAFVLPDTPLSGAQRTAERVRSAIAEIVVNGPAGEPVRVTATFGAAAFPAFASADALIDAADGALYAGKRSGKNRVDVAAGSTTETPPDSQKLVAPAA